MSKIEIEIPDGFYFDKETMSVRKKPEFEFEYVDLGLPSGTLWATCNVGAKEDIDCGFDMNFRSAQKFNCPSKEQIKELVENTTSLWIVKDSVTGRLFVGKNGNNIFLPATGYYNKGTHFFEGLFGYYWSSTPNPDYANDAYDLYFNSDGIDTRGYDARCNKYYVRTVKNG